MLSRLCVLWPRFGPYHLARLEAAHRLLAPEIEVIGLETAGLERLNQWAVDDGPVHFNRVQVFPNRVFEDIPPREMERGVRDALDRLQPDAVAIMSYSYPDARAALSWCRKNRKAAILATDTKEDDARRIAWRESIKRMIISEFDSAIVSGSPQTRYLVKLGMPLDLIFSGYNVVDNNYYRNKSQQYKNDTSWTSRLPGLKHDKKFFLSINRLLPFKNIDGLIKSYSKYRTITDDPWQLLLVGDGPDRDRLEQLVQALEVKGVTFCGYQTPDHIAAYLGYSSAFIHPTFKDTWGLVVNEAMAAGLPIILSRRAGCAEDLVKDGVNGFLFEPNDTNALAHIMNVISSGGADLESMSAHSLALIENYNLDRFVKGLHAAAVAGLSRADRPMKIGSTAILFLLRIFSRKVTSFHTAEL